MNTNELAELIKGRRSVRAWQSRVVPDNLLLQAIELATYAPNAGNQQNWRFYVVTKRDIIDQIANAVQASADEMAVWPESAQFGEAAKNMFKKASFFRGAPAVIAVAASQYTSPAEQIMALREKVDPKAKAMREWRNIANSKIQSVSSAIAYLLLVLHQMGLGAVWMTGPIQAKGAIENVIKVPAGTDIVALIPVGYPAENPPLKERKAVNTICEFIR
ncbi:MAG TPA: nitroreductase family protein [Dehalococcoidales bacterium]|nr:nitroreductase family protein [Dehalococcoidales bacterium]